MQTLTKQQIIVSGKRRFRIVSVMPSPGDDIVGADVDISTAYVPEFDLTYFFNKNLAAELILATTKHDVEIENGADLGHVWLLPPTLNLQYHFYANEFKPYVRCWYKLHYILRCRFWRC